MSVEGTSMGLRRWRPFFVMMLMAALTLTAVPARADEAKKPAAAAGSRAPKSESEKPKPASSKDDEKSGAEKADEKPKPPQQIHYDPETQRRIDEALGRAASSRAAARKSSPLKPSTKKPRPRSATPDPKVDSRKPVAGKSPAKPPSAPPATQTTEINIPAAEPIGEDVSPEDRTYAFSIKDGTYEQLIEGIARQTGLGVIGEAPKDGRVSFVTSEALTFEEMMDRVRTLLFNYKPLDPYTIERHETHLQVIRVNDHVRGLSRDRMFRSEEEFRAADLPSSVLALMIYTLKSGSLADLTEVRNQMPDYVRVTPLEGQNRLTIYALVSDIEKYLSLIDFFKGSQQDPRTLEIIELEYILPSVALTQLEQLMDLNGGGATKRRTPKRPKGRTPQPNPLVTMPEPEVSLMAQDDRGVILVRAMQVKIAEIKLLLPYIDVDTAPDPIIPVTIPVEHADPAELIANIQQVLAAQSPGGAVAAPKRGKPRKGRAKSATSGVTVAAKGLTLLPHPSEKAILVLAEKDEDVDHVRRLVAMFDLETRVGPIKIMLQHGNADELATTLTQLLGGAAAPRGKKVKATSAGGFSLSADVLGDALWYSGSTEKLDKVHELLVILDVEKADTLSLHIVELRYQVPSFVSNMLRAYDQGTPGASVSKAKSRKGVKKGRRTVPNASKFTADDERGRLLVLCTDQEWHRYEPFIQELEEGAVTPLFRRLAVTNISPADAVNQLRAMVTGAGDIRYVPSEDSLLIFDATDVAFENIQTVLAEIDRPDDKEERTFEIKHADMSELISIIERLAVNPGGAAPKSKPKRKGKAGKGRAIPAPLSSPDVTLLPYGRKLIVRARSEKMAEIAELIQRFDVADAGREMITYDDFAPGTDVVGLAAQLRSMLSQPAATAPRGKNVKRSLAGGATTQIIPQPAANRLIVLANEAAHEEIVELLPVVRADFEPLDIIQRTFEIRFADPAALTTAIETLVGNTGTAGSPARPKRGKKKAGSVAPVTRKELTIIPMGGRRLIVRTTPDKMEKVSELIAEFDVDQNAREMHVFEDFQDGADIIGITNRLSDAISARAPAKTRKKGVPRVAGPQFFAQPAAGRLVVMASASELPQIEELLAIFRAEVVVVENEVVFILVSHADPALLIEQIEPLLAMKERTLVAMGLLVDASGAVGGGKGKGKVRKGGATGATHFHLAVADKDRIVIAAPAVLVEEAVKLVADFDVPGAGEIVFRTVELQRATATEMVQAISQLRGAAAPRKTGKGSKNRRGKPAAGGSGFTITEAPGGSAIVLRGPAEDVEQALAWIDELDAGATGEQIKVYEIAHADIRKLVDLIMNVADGPAAGGKRKGQVKKRATPTGKGATVDLAEDVFATSLTRRGNDIFLQADLIANTMLVAASSAKLARVDAIVAQFDVGNSTIDRTFSDAGVPSFMYQLEHVTATEVLWDIEDLLALDAFWPHPETPEVDTTSVMEDVLVISHPRKELFGEIEELIRKYIDVPGDPVPDKRIRLAVPPGMTAQQAAHLLMMQRPDLQFDLIDLTPDLADDKGIERLTPPAKQASAAKPCVLPAVFHQATAALLADALGLQNEGGSELPAGEPKKGAAASEPPAKKTPEASGKDETTLDATDAAILDRVREMEANAAIGGLPSDPETTGVTRTASNGGDRARRPRRRQAEAKKLQILIDEDGNLILSGEEDTVEDFKDALVDLAKDMEGISVAPDIRIYRVRYIDVNEAATIINEMFNASRAQMQAIQQQQRAAQTRARQQAAVQKRQQAAKQGNAKGGQTPGKGKTPGVNIPQLPPEAVRVFANPRDRTLILRADTNQFPAILDLLATIDQPKPINSKLRIYQLKKLNAADVESMLSDVLGLGAARSSGRRSSAARGGNKRGGVRTPSRSTAVGGSLPEQLVQETVSGTNALGVDPADIKLSSNVQSNTIHVMAPEVALDYIGEIIDQLENQDLPERVTEHFVLEHANPQDAADYLTSQFSAGGMGAVARIGRGGRRAPVSTGPSLNVPSFVAYARLNMLSAEGTPEQIEKVIELIARIDVERDGEGFQTVTLLHADAGDVASTLTSLFGGGSTPARRAPRGRGPRQAPVSTGSGPSFIGQAGQRILFFSAPEALHEEIHNVIADLEGRAQEILTPRIIDLVNAKPSTVAEAIQSAFGSGASRGRRSGGRRGASSSSSRFTITAHDASKRLFVMADDEMFGQVESLARSLDVAGDIGFDVRVYPLQHADATATLELLNQLVTDFLRRAPRGSTNIEAFSARADENSNSLIVMGGPSIFGFLESKLSLLDSPMNKRSAPGFFMVALKSANAQEVAGNITRLWNARTLPTGVKPPQAEANRSLNVLIVRGTQKQIDEIKQKFIDPLEEQIPDKLLMETMALEHANPEVVADSINRIFTDMADAIRRLGRGASSVNPLDYTVIVTPDVDSKQIIVQASKENMEIVRTRLAELDQPGRADTATSIKIYPVKYADPNVVVNFINQWSRSRATRGGRGRSVAARDVVVALADNATGSVMVTASQSNHLVIQQVVDGLDDESLSSRKRKQYVLPLAHANAGDVVNQFGEIYRNQTRRRGDRGPTFVAAPKTNSIVASLNDEELEGVNHLLESIDVESDLSTQRSTVPYALSYADPGSINAAILNMFRWDRRSQGSLTEQVTSFVDWGTRSVIVTASPKNHEVVSKMIADVDIESTVSKELHIVKLKEANADDVARAMQTIFRGRPRTGRGDQPVQVTAEASSNALIISANAKEMGEVDALIDALDVKPEESRQQQVRSFRLTYANPWNVRDAINGLFRTSRNPRDRVSAVPESGSNSVIVSASPEYMTRVENLIKDLDSQGSVQRSVEVITLNNADSSSVSRALDAIYVRSAQRSRGGEQPISISEIQGSKSIVVKANQIDMAKIKATVAELDTTASARGEEVRVVPLLHNDANEMKTWMQEYLRKTGGRGRNPELAGDVRLGVLLQANALVISGELEEVERLEATILEMDLTAGESGGNRARLIRLTYADPMQVLPTLQELFTNQRGGGRRGQVAPVITVNEQLGALVVRASAMEFEDIKAMVAELDVEGAEPAPGFRIIQVPRGHDIEQLALDLESGINDTASRTYGGSGGGRGRSRGRGAPQITIMPQQRSSRLFVTGSTSLFDEVEKAVLALADSGGPGGPTTVKVLRPSRLTVDEVRRVIEQMKGEGSGSSNSSRGRRSSSSNRGRSSGRRPSSRGSSRRR